MLSPGFISCDFIRSQNESISPPDTEELVNVEKEFSQMAKERGVKKAFLKYMDKEGVLLRPGEMPITGANAIEFLSQVNDTGYNITWHPEKAEISADGGLGYTYGIYQMEINNDTIMGTYVNIWKRQDGEWRFVLNSGNQGITNN